MILRSFCGEHPLLCRGDVNQNVISIDLHLIVDLFILVPGLSVSNMKWNISCRHLNPKETRIKCMKKRTETGFLPKANVGWAVDANISVRCTQESRPMSHVACKENATDAESELTIEGCVLLTKINQSNDLCHFCNESFSWFACTCICTHIMFGIGNPQHVCFSTDFSTHPGPPRTRSRWGRRILWLTDPKYISWQKNDANLFTFYCAMIGW